MDTLGYMCKVMQHIRDEIQIRIIKEYDRRTVSTKTFLYHLGKRMSKRVQIQLMENHPHIFSYLQDYIGHVCDRAKLVAVSREGSQIRYMSNPSDAIQVTAVKNYPVAYSAIQNPCERASLAALHRGMDVDIDDWSTARLKTEVIKDSPWKIKFLDNPSERHQILVASIKPWSIAHIKNVCIKAQLTAMIGDPLIYHSFDNPSEEIQKLHFKQVIAGEVPPKNKLSVAAKIAIEVITVQPMDGIKFPTNK